MNPSLTLDEMRGQWQDKATGRRVVSVVLSGTGNGKVAVHDISSHHGWQMNIETLRKKWELV